MTRRPRRKSVRRRKTGRKMMIARPRATYTTNTASIKENYSVPVLDGNVTFFRSTQLADIIYDRAQTVAQAYQQFRIKYIKLYFRPSADTFPAVVGNTIPQLYFMIDKANAIPTNATAGTFFSMGCRPRRMDDKNITYSWSPTALTADFSAPGVVTASQLRTSPWLSTNANSGNPGAVWQPSQVDHLGCAFYVTKINPGDTITYTVDVEVVFQFRKPLWKGSDSSESVNNQKIENGQLLHVLSGQPVVPSAPQL